MKILRTEYAALIGIFLILLATVKHAFEVYTSVMYPQTEPTLWQNIYIAVMLIAIDFAVILFTIHGNSYAAKTFAFMIFLVNLFAFWQEIPWEGWSEVGITRYIPGLLFSSMFAYGLYYFTELFSELLQKQNQLGELQEELDKIKESKKALEEKVDSLTSGLAKAEEKKAELSQHLHQTEKQLQAKQLDTFKISQYDLLINYIIETEGYLEKSPEALRKGVEYWQKKATESKLEAKNQVKLLAYQTASELRS